MKKFLTVLLILVMVFTFAACGNGGDQGDGGKEFLAVQLGVVDLLGYSLSHDILLLRHAQNRGYSRARATSFFSNVMGVSPTVMVIFPSS